MEENTVVAFRNPSNFQDDPLTEVLRAGVRELLAQAVEAEVAEFLEGHATLVDDRGRRRIVRNGHLPERLIQTGIGPVDVRQPRVRDRRAGEGAGAIRFTSAILPRYLRRTKSLEDLLPWLYLRGISSGDFSEALAALLGAQAPGLSASTIGRLKEVWQDEMERWQRRDLSAKRYVYFWVDGIYFGARLEEEKQCILVIIGATDHGTKELIAITDGYRESKQSWREVLLDLKRRGLGIGPELVTGDGALGFWKALRQVYGAAREQRCWVHKTGNILNKLPKGLQNKAKGHLQDIWMAETRKDAETAFDFFLEAYGPKYEKATACLAKDRDALLSFYDFPAEHWKHVRTTNPIESTFATVRLRTYRTKGCLSRKTAMAMVFKLCQGASKKWRRLNGSDQFAEIIRGVKFVNGERQDRSRRMTNPYTTFDNSSSSATARSVRRRKVRAAKLIADGLWVDLRRGKYDPIRQLRVGTPDADHVSCLPAGPTLAFAAGLAGVGSPRTPGSSRQRCGRCTGLGGVLCALRGGRSTQRPLRAVDDGQGADLCLRDGHILLARGGEEAGGGCSVSDARGGQLPATSHGM